MKKLTIIIQIHNNFQHLEECLKSIEDLNCEIIIGITTNNSEPFAIAENFTKNIYFLSFDNDFSKAKNELILKSNNDFIFFMQPNEILIRGKEEIEEISQNYDVYKINLIHDNVITKPTRMWHKSKKCFFQNPVYEYVKSDAKQSNIYLQYKSVDNFNLNLEMLQKWLEKTPLAIEPLYYKSCLMLSKMSYDDFINTATYYLFKENNKSMSYVLTKYYLGTVYCYIKKDFQNAIKCAVECLTYKPLMAEFWCLLGDIYYSLDKYDKAYHFYDNAIILGSRRLKNDDWPFHIDKYKKNPEEMMTNCLEIMTNSKQYLISKQHLNR